MNTIPKVQEVKDRFADMLDPRHSIRTVRHYARDICASVENDETNWDELGFIKDDVIEQLRRAHVREAIAYFADMSKIYWSIGTVEHFAKNICGLVENEVTNWRELGFAKNDVVVRLRKARVREAKRKFDNMSEPALLYSAVKASAIYIRMLVLDDDEVPWEVLGFTNEAVAKLLRQAKARVNA